MVMISGRLQVERVAFGAHCIWGQPMLVPELPHQMNNQNWNPILESVQLGGGTADCHAESTGSKLDWAVRDVVVMHLPRLAFAVSLSIPSSPTKVLHDSHHYSASVS